MNVREMRIDQKERDCCMCAWYDQKSIQVYGKDRRFTGQGGN
jgi:hypothetical protein